MDQVVNDATCRADQVRVVETPRASRLKSIDMLRGLVMLIMALDHVRDYFHVDATRFDPMDLAKTNAVLFFTRFITHYCAPTFALLAGCGAGLGLIGGKRRSHLAQFLLTRGLWLIVLDWTVVTFLWGFPLSPPYQSLLGIIWSIGVSMVVLSALCHLPRRVVGGIGLLIIFGHNLLDPLTPADFGRFGVVWEVLHEGGVIIFSRGFSALFFYPVLPWIGIVLAGFGLSGLYAESPERRRRMLLLLGGGCLALFVLLRGFNIYGDPAPWTPRSAPLVDLFAILNVQKYPPSLAYDLVTLGPSLILLALFERVRGWLVDFLAAIGRVPLFYYLFHLLVIHLCSMLVEGLEGHSMVEINQLVFTRAPGTGPALTLGETYLAWAAITFGIVVPASLWYDGFKRRNRSVWLSYL